MNININQQYGKVIVLNKTNQRKNGSILWLCECTICNSKVLIRKDHLIRRETTNTSCPKCYRVGKHGKTWTGFEEVPGKLFAQYRISANRRNIPFEISLEDIWNNYNKQDKKCVLTGQNIQFSNTLSIDRIDPFIGYYPENIQCVFKPINRMKWSFNNLEFIQLCRDISINQHEIGEYIPFRYGQRITRWTGYEDITGRYYTELKKGANKRKLIFDVTIQQLWQLFLSQNYRCAVSGKILRFSSKTELITASVDRINNSLGYTLDNIQWVHKNINMSKGKTDNQIYIDRCKKIAIYTKNTIIPSNTIWNNHKFIIKHHEKLT